MRAARQVTCWADVTSKIDRGDLFWLVEGDGPAHPYVVVQDDVFNHSRVATVVVCALTSRLALASELGNVLLDPGEGDLPVQSVVVVSQVQSVARSALGARIGALSQARVDQILDGLKFQQRAFFSR